MQFPKLVPITFRQRIQFPTGVTLLATLQIAASNALFLDSENIELFFELINFENIASLKEQICIANLRVMF